MNPYLNPARAIEEDRLHQLFGRCFDRPRFEKVTVADVEWVRQYWALARQQCAACHGTGLDVGYRPELCKCVCRRVFEFLMRRYRENDMAALHTCGCAVSIVPQGVDHHYSWGRANEEYNADLWLLAKRTLDPLHFQVFRLHCIDGHDWHGCCARLRIARGHFFHCVYRMQEAVGRAAVAIRPYPLFPIDAYIGVASIDLSQPCAFRRA